MEDVVEAQRLVRCGFNEIIVGYTPLTFRRNELYIKHFGSRDQIEVDVVYKNALDKLKERGVPTSEEKALQLKEDGLWTSKDEDKLLSLAQELEGLRKTKRLLFLKSQMDDHQKLIDEREKEYYGWLVQKNELFGKTAEFFANKRVSDFCIVNSIFTESECHRPYFDKAGMFDLDDETIEEISRCYNVAVQKFDEPNLKKIALAPLFQNYYYLAKSVYEFYGRAITQLTFYQIQLVSFGDHYKSILYGQENPPPSEVCSDPEKLDEWMTGSSHAKKVMASTLGGELGEGEGAAFTSLVGAKKEDLEYLGVNDGHKTVSLKQKLKEKGGHMDMKDLMALQGLK